ncbi:hypothetical protein F5051DRAFT_450810 [Lentinula edodes]|nr:hypothetical protein F5051DRAFT_450810 [Lentinula edodes]
MKVVHSLVPSQSSDSPSSHGATGNAYGYLSSYPTLVLSLPDLRELVQLISEHLDVETPFVFSNGGSTVSQGSRGVPLAIDLDAGRVKRLIDNETGSTLSKIRSYTSRVKSAFWTVVVVWVKGAAWRPHLTVSLFRISYCPPPSAIPSSSTSTAPDPTSFESTCTAYLRSVHATEHYLLSFIRWQDTPTSLSGGGSGAGGIPGRLKEWIKDYPRTLSGHARVFAIADLCWEAVDSEIENNIVLDREMEHRLYVFSLFGPYPSHSILSPPNEEDAPPMYALGPNTTGSSQIQSLPPSSELLQAVADHPEPSSREKFEYALQLRMSQVAVLEYVEGAEGAADKLPKVFQWIAEKRGMNGDQTHGAKSRSRMPHMPGPIL